MKLIHIISSLEIGGAQRLLADLLPIQKAQGLDVTLLVYQEVDNDFTKKIETSNIPIISLHTSNFRSPWNILRIHKIISQYDIVHVHLFPSLYWVALASIGTKCRLVYTEHSTSNERRGKWYFRPIEKAIYNRYHKIVAISQQTKDSLCQWIEVHNNRVIVVNNGIDLSKYKVEHNHAISTNLIMISRFVPSKDHATVIRAMQKLTNSQLFLVGTGELIQACKELATQLKVNDRIHFLGARTDIPQLLSKSGIGIQSSNWEGFGLTAVEIMASGIPVIASDVDGLKQVVEGAGLVFPLNNEEELIKHIIFLQNNKEGYLQVANRCIQRAKQYDIHIMAESYKTIYKGMNQS